MALYPTIIELKLFWFQEFWTMFTFLIIFQGTGFPGLSLAIRSVLDKHMDRSATLNTNVVKKHWLKLVKVLLIFIYYPLYKLYTKKPYQRYYWFLWVHPRNYYNIISVRFHCSKPILQEFSLNLISHVLIEPHKYELILILWGKEWNNVNS